MRGSSMLQVAGDLHPLITGLLCLTSLESTILAPSSLPTYDLSCRQAAHRCLQMNATVDV